MDIEKATGAFFSRKPTKTPSVLSNVKLDAVIARIAPLLEHTVGLERSGVTVAAVFTQFPLENVHGEIARTYFYMADRYKLKLSKS
jgi:hypothetical protein